MRTSAFSAAVLAFSISGLVFAHDDFDALLSDLSFGEVSSQNGLPTESAKVIQDDTLRNLFPTPAGMSTPGMLESDSEPQVVTSPEPAQSIKSEQSSELMPVPQVALMEPIPSSTPVTTIDFGSVFEVERTSTAPVKTVGHHPHQACETGDCGTGHFDTGASICRPRGTVNLPSSTFYEYFRSHPCYTNVWDGYGINCGSHHKHLHGECDCFKNSGHGKCSGGSSCDACGGR